ncbi:MAG: hypothetical protein OSJ64_00020 [Firmicutes bacterium]|nr:hypothetical protein [Bacillota bacterium]
MENRDLKYFMRRREAEIVSVPGPESFRDDDGNVLQLEVKKLMQEEIDKINNAYFEREMAMDKKGNPLVFNGEVIWKTKRDPAKASRHLIVEALQYPNLKDQDMMKFYGVVDVTDMPLKVFSSPEEYSHVVRVIMEVLGLRAKADDKEDLQAAKN